MLIYKNIMYIPVDERNMSPDLVRAYRILSPTMAFCNVRVIKLIYFKA